MMMALLHHSTQQPHIELDVYLSTTLLDDAVSVSVTLTADTTAHTLQQTVLQQLAAASAPQRSTPANVVLTLVSNRQDWEAIATNYAETSVQPPDLHWILDPSGANWQGSVVYNSHLFQVATIERMVGHLKQLAQGMDERSDRPITTLSMLTPAELQQQVVDWSSPRVAYPPVPIFHAIETHAVQQPDAIALRYNDQMLTYSAFNQRANQLAHYLADLGVALGVR
ncbi:MAG TPA: AMP-binding protein, partial [Candidatus Obscuribacterales bacterium]